MKFIIAAFLTSLSIELYSQSAFSYLAEHKIDYDICRTELIIRHNKDFSETFNTKSSELPKEHLLYDDGVVESTLVLKTNLGDSNNTEIQVLFSGGMSCDLGYWIYAGNSANYIGTVQGEEIIIPGNGSIYTIGHNNNAFLIRRKYMFSNGKLEEVKPEFYYVGLTTKTLKPIELFIDEELTEKLASLPANYNIEVLTAKRTTEERWKWRYLIKTSFGLVGWAEIEAGKFKSIEVEGIQFMGD